MKGVKMQKIIETISYLSMVIGCAGIDGDHMVISGIMAIGGLAIISVVACKEYLIEGARK